jgi:hypothetical protein
MTRKMTKTEQVVVAHLNGLNTDDPERAHATADADLLHAVHPEVAAAYQRVVERTRWWACA